ncbi:histidine phosphatase family protein [Microbulbifer sp. OS29]|uniref:Histidine phosphatase family protein n=1 Tax=Microbulbifer okhotskensis TaxID=2926617 RepID=A0A9X2J6H4_9GAMM|nr:histidine phosphatase family protein [Microbulbifer okhotskensis]MCO1334620.1 histidine phosphatase family protein [Microbulbifer okhotskensis]
MSSRLKLAFFCLFFVLFSAGSTYAVSTESEPQVIYLIRHAEKEKGPGTGRDPHLTEAGQRRAQQLAYILGEVDIEAVYSTDYNRTRETATPLAKELDLDVNIYNPKELKQFAETLAQAGNRVLVVGHSNTTRKLAELLGGEKGRPIREASEFDRLYILVRDGDQVTTLIHRYGAVKPPRTDNTVSRAAQSD